MKVFEKRTGASATRVVLEQVAFSRWLRAASPPEVVRFRRKATPYDFDNPATAGIDRETFRRISNRVRRPRFVTRGRY